MNSVIVTIPNWNGENELPGAIESILSQTYTNFSLLIVDNGSTDRSKEIIELYKLKDKRIRSLYRTKNYGYTGGVNPGMELAIREHAAYAATINNDAVAKKDWLKNLVAFLDANPSHGIATGMIVGASGETIDSTGEEYSSWGLPFPRDRDEPVSTCSRPTGEIFGASGGASMYRTAMLQKIGLFDQDFFAYYEDIDLSFRAQLSGWKVAFVADAVVVHERGNTSARLAKRKAGDHSTTPFLTKQFMKNVPFVLIKNVPARLFWLIMPRLIFAWVLLFGQALISGRGLGAIQGALLFWARLPKKIGERWRIQKSRRVSTEYIWDMFVQDLPTSAGKLRKIRAFWRR
ncbi:MAG: glycosyltransferase family 2 protein [Candidatus Saccharimonadales bacterium]